MAILILQPCNRPPANRSKAAIPHKPSKSSIPSCSPSKIIILILVPKQLLRYDHFWAIPARRSPDLPSRSRGPPTTTTHLGSLGAHNLEHSHSVPYKSVAPSSSAQVRLLPSARELALRRGVVVASTRIRPPQSTLHKQNALKNNHHTHVPIEINTINIQVRLSSFSPCYSGGASHLSRSTTAPPTATDEENINSYENTDNSRYYPLPRKS